MVFISVDFPAPFTPSSPIRWSDCSEKVMSSRMVLFSYPAETSSKTRSGFGARSGSRNSKVNGA